MTAHMPPPTVRVQEGEASVSGRLTATLATQHAARIQRSLASLEELIGEMPAGGMKERLQHRALRLHNHLAQGGRALNDHFQTAQISPDSAGGDKDPPTQPQVADVRNA